MFFFLRNSSTWCSFLEGRELQGLACMLVEELQNLAFILFEGLGNAMSDLYASCVFYLFFLEEWELRNLAFILIEGQVNRSFVERSVIALLFALYIVQKESRTVRGIRKIIKNQSMRKIYGSSLE
ncbi:uncharacterized protein G2W53_041086 [Senna tora]|uniref:Uncharacterized protein n=1 Tax=Senna tora TaxID=362788 RepID=A0A834SGI4_9FABA|nr:uncharacterized protein G2W53_041086 [Senna tora]